MSKTRVMNRSKIVLLSIFLLLISLTSTRSFAQGPTAPEASSFEPVDATDMVNLLTGDFTYVMPLLNVPSPEGGYPIALANHSGIAMEQEASWTGLGWNINPGAVTRSVSGVPDDWKDARSFSSIYNAGGVIESYGGSISVGWGKDGASVGLYGSYSTHKSVNGENSHRFDIGATASIGNMGGYLGTNGMGINANFGQSWRLKNGYTAGVSGSIGFNKNFVDGSTTINANGGLSVGKGNGTGISLNSRGNLNVGMISGSIAGRGNNLSGGLNIDGRYASLGINIGVFSLGYNHSKEKYWLYENEYKIHHGTLYAGDLTNLFSNTEVPGRIHFDAYESDMNSEKSKITEANFSAPNYDNYVVSGQGIGGSLTPHILQQGVLPMGYNALAERDNGFLQSFMVYFYPDNSQKFDKKVGNGILSKEIHFNFENEISSYIKVKSDNWNVPTSGASYNDIFNFQPQNRVTDDILVKNGVSYDGYSEAYARLRKGHFVEVFTNNEIKSNPYLIIEPNNFNRAGSEIPGDGIGGYKITTQDGKTYHYSLPVYQKERFSKSTSLDISEEDSFQESFQVEPYATHWLLTAITGPDYIDVNNDQKLDASDYGYWVSFDYGKWSDGFIWRNPAGDYFRTNRNKSYQWGRKEVYYLDKIITRTHTALFVKSVREDNHSAEIDYRNGSNPLVYRDNHVKSFDVGANGSPYLIGSLHPFEVTHVNAYEGETKSIFYIETHPQRSLKLDKIILVKNGSNAANVSKSNSNQSSPINLGRIEIETEARFYDSNSNHIVTADQYYTLHDVPNWQGEFFGNVLDEGDLINAPDIESEALKKVDFGYIYSLATSSPNSTAPNGGKLTLDKVTFVGKNNLSLIPPYDFNYSFSSVSYNMSVDDWGYPSTNTTAWSLREIKTPAGGKITIEYEEDDYHKEAAPSNFVFDSKFEMRFIGSNFGNKYVEFRNQTDNLPEEDINFLDYFALNDVHRVNVQYVEDDSSSEFAADVDKMCTVTEVTATSVKFQIPTSGVQTEERNDIVCFEDNWVCYKDFESVVLQTFNWVREHNEGSCSEVTNGSRAKIQFFSDKILTNQNGGGLRVKNLLVSDEEGNNYKTSYDYTNPNTGNSSGIVSYAPSKDVNKRVEHISHLPSPTVMYEYVAVTHDVTNSGFSSKEQYKYNVLEPMVVNGLSFSMGDELSLNISQNQNTDVIYNGTSAKIKESKMQLVDKLSGIGRLESLKVFNSEDQLLSETVHYYDGQQEQGLVEETFDTYKRIWDYENYSPDIYCLSSSSTIKYPNVLTQTKIIGNGNENSTYIKDIDFNTGIPLETETVDSKGNTLKTISIPAFAKYTQMGSKADDPHNRNMLSQIAANYALIDENGTWQPVGVGISTWNNDWNYVDHDGSTNSPVSVDDKIWRQHKTYIWDGEINSKGHLLGYNLANDDGFNWSLGATQPALWKETSSIEKYDHFSHPLEVKDINNNFASTKMAETDGKVLLTSNAAYGEAFYTGAEYKDTTHNWLDQQIYGSDLRTDTRSHTGIYSIEIGTSSNFLIKLKNAAYRTGTYKLSAWVHKDNVANARFVGPGSSAVEFNGEKVIAGEWVQLNHYYDILSNSGDKDMKITSNSGTIYVDDVRFHPIASSMTSYVYNEYDELSFILGANNMGTKYLYDAAGRLNKVFQEMEDTPTITGGFVLASKYKYNYKENFSGGGGGGGNDDVVTLIPVSENDGLETSYGVISGPPGAEVTIKQSIVCGQVTGNFGHFKFSDDFFDPVFYDFYDQECGSPTERTTTVIIPEVDSQLFCYITYEDIGNTDINQAGYGKVELISTNQGTISTENYTLTDYGLDDPTTAIEASFANIIEDENDPASTAILLASSGSVITIKRTIDPGENGGSVDFVIGSLINDSVTFNAGDPTTNYTYTIIMPSGSTSLDCSIYYQADSGGPPETTGIAKLEITSCSPGGVNIAHNVFQDQDLYDEQ